MIIPKTNKPSDAELRNHSAFIRSLGVCVAKYFRPEPCNGDIQSCHVRAGFNCMADKPVGAEIPMCKHHHIDVQHRIGETRFYELLNGGIPRIKGLANMLWAFTGKKQDCLRMIVGLRK